MTLAATLYETPTLASADPLDEQSYQCDGCRKWFDATGILDSHLVGAEPGLLLCHSCASTPYRLTKAAIEAANRPAPSWSPTCEDGNHCRAERARLLRESDYRAAPDFPQSEEVKQAWAAYRQALRDITETYASPDAVEWPVAPS